MYPSRAGSNCFSFCDDFAGRPEAGKVSFRRIGGTFIPSVQGWEVSFRRIGGNFVPYIQGWEVFVNTEARMSVR